MPSIHNTAMMVIVKAVVNMFSFKGGNCLSVLEIVKKEFE